MKKAKLSGAIFLLAAVVIIMGGSSDVYGRACTLLGGGGTLGEEFPNANGDDFTCSMDVDMEVVDVTRQPEDAHVDYGAPYPSGNPFYVIADSGEYFLADYRVIMSYTMTCDGQKNKRTYKFKGLANDDSGGFIWWAAGDTCGPFATWFQNLLATDVAGELKSPPEKVVLKELTDDNEEDLAKHFEVIWPGEGLLWDEPMLYHVKFIITKTP